MKISIIICLIFFSISGYSQNFENNNCSEKLQFIFLGSRAAEWQSNNHKMACDYLNIVIVNENILYKGEPVLDKDDLEIKIKRDSTLYKEFDVVIGVENDVPFEVVSTVFCWLDEFNLYWQIKDVVMYHFD